MNRFWIIDNHLISLIIHSIAYGCGRARSSNVACNSSIAFKALKFITILLLRNSSIQFFSLLITGQKVYSLNTKELSTFILDIFHKAAEIEINKYRIYHFQSLLLLELLSLKFLSHLCDIK